MDSIECPACKKLFDFDDAGTHASTIVCPHCKTDLKVADERDVYPGKKVGDYIVKSELGIGGMGSVYLAEQVSMCREVALKVLQPSLVANKSYLSRFQREIRNLANVDHPNVVAALEAGNDGDIYFFSMTYVPGEDLKKRLERGEVLEEKEAFRIALEVAKALKYAWEKHGMLHRDIKPANIIVTPANEVKLMDLGISKRMDEDVDLTMVGMMVGSPMYISPEQARGERDLDFRADMYSLGATLYHILVGKAPYEGENSVAIISRHFTEPVPDPRKERAGLSPLSAKIIAGMMGKKKEERYPSWEQLIDDMETLIAGEGGEASSTVSAECDTKFAAKERAVVAPPAPVPSPAHASVRSSASSIVAPSILLKALLARAGTLAGVLARGFVRSLNIRRILGLSAILVLAVLMFFWVIQEGVKQTRREKAEALLADAKVYMEANPPPSGTVEALRRLTEVLKIRDTESAAKACMEIETLKKRHIKTVRDKKQESIKRDLDEMKSQSHACELKGDFDKAIEVWRTYQEKGLFAKELKMEIDRSINVLKILKAERDAGTMQ